MTCIGSISILILIITPTPGRGFFRGVFYLHWGGARYPDLVARKHSHIGIGLLYFNGDITMMDSSDLFTQICCTHTEIAMYPVRIKNHGSREHAGYDWGRLLFIIIPKTPTSQLLSLVVVTDTRVSTISALDYNSIQYASAPRVFFAVLPGGWVFFFLLFFIFIFIFFTISSHVKSNPTGASQISQYASTV
jgi:hypothetical protein